MAGKRVLEKPAKRLALVIWGAASVALLAVLVMPLYLYWEKVAARPDYLIPIGGTFLWAMFAWSRMVFGIGRAIQTAPEK